MTSPNPMALEAKALEAAAHAYYIQSKIGFVVPPWENAGSDLRQYVMGCVKEAIRAYLAALPPPAAGEGLEPVACEHCGGSGYITKWVSDVLAAGDVGYIRREHSDVRCSSCNGTGRATPAARAAVLEAEVIFIGAAAIMDGLVSKSDQYVSMERFEGVVRDANEQRSRADKAEATLKEKT